MFLLSLFSGSCPTGPTVHFIETASSCYVAIRAKKGRDEATPRHFTSADARKACLKAANYGSSFVSTVLGSISSENEQQAVQKAIRHSDANVSTVVWTAMRIHQIASANGSYWLDSTNERIEFTNFAAAGPQTQAGVACVVLMGNREYQWKTTDCLARFGSAAVCVTGKGEQHIQRFRLGLKAG